MFGQLQLSWKIAFRYFKSKKSIQVINIITWISVFAVSVLAASMLILLSVFNGFDHLIKGFYNSFYPDVKISVHSGKFFTLDEGKINEIKHLPGVKYFSQSLEDLTLFTLEEEQRIGVLKGVDEEWFSVNNIDPYVQGLNRWGSYHNEQPPCIIGRNFSYALGIDIERPFHAITAFYPKSNSSGVLQPESALNSLLIYPRGDFQIQDDFDGKYILAPLAIAQKLFNNSGYSSIELRLENNASDQKVKQQIEKILGSEFNVATRFEQNKVLYLIMQAEKWAVFAILFFVMIIASFTLVGVLSMLVIEKKKDIAILISMGAEKSMIKSIFIFLGAIITLSGGLLGIVLGAILCGLQQYFGFVSLGEGFIISAYPVLLSVMDMFIILAATLIIGLITAWIPARKAAMQQVDIKSR